MGKQRWIAFAAAAFISFLLFPSFFDLPVSPLSTSAPGWRSLDPSWKLLLNRTAVEELTWGKDFVLTYGPSGFLSTRIGWGISKYSLLLFDLFVCLNFFCLVYLSWLKGKSRFLTLLVFAGLPFFLPIHYGASSSLVLLAFLLFWLRQSLEEPKALHYLFQLCLLILLFFMKFNTGLVSFVFYFAGIAYHFLSGKGNKKLLTLFGLAPFLLVPLVCTWLKVDLRGYIAGGLETISGYNEIMYADGGLTRQLIFCLISILLSGVLIAERLYTEAENRKRILLLSAILLASVYILYKQAFVRSDIQHVIDFYKYLLLFVLCGYGFQEGRQRWLSRSILLVLLGICLYFSKNSEDSFFHFRARFVKTGYVKSFFAFKGEQPFKDSPRDRLIPPRVLDKIGNKSVDVFPWNAQLLMESRLNYSQRPVPQSYTAYTPYLEELNFAFYNSARAPDFVLYEFEAIDGRYPLFDEPKLNLVLMKNYSCVDTFSMGEQKLLLLAKKPEAKKIVLEKVREFEMDITQGLVPAADKYYELEVSYSFSGICYSFLRHAPALSLVVKTKDGKRHEYKSSAKLLETGIFSEQFFGDTPDFRNRLESDSTQAEEQVRSYGIKPGKLFLFGGKVKVKEWKMR